MGVVIKATGASASRTIKSSIAHAAAAAEECVRAAGIAVDDIDLLINVGVFRDDNMVEPSMAALVQREIGLNLDYVKSPSKKPAFSFDVMNGACGALNAIQIASAAILAGSAEHALVVSSDAHPSNARDVPGFPYAAVGGAILLGRDDGDRGFGRVALYDAEDAFAGTVAYLDHATMGARGRSALTVERHPEYEARLLDHAAESARAYARDEGIDLARTLLVTSQPSPRFGADLAARLGVPVDRVAPAADVGGDPHTSAIALAYHAASRSGQLARFERALFVAAGAGLTSACAVYRA